MSYTLPLQSREGDLGTPRAMLPKGSPDWAYRTLNRLKWALEQKRITEGEYDGILEELDRFQVWNIIPPEKPYGSREAMLKAEIGYSEAEGRNRCGLNPPGVKANDITSYIVTGDSIPDRGNRKTYLRTRLDRDHPDIKSRLDSGEFPSVRAAALEAGIVQPSFQCPEDPLKASRRLLLHFSGDTLTTLLTELANHAGFDLTPHR